MSEIQKLKSGLAGLLKKGFFHIAGTNVLNKVIAALTNILIARFLGKHNYGVFGAAFNVYNIFVIFSGLGMTGAILLFCSESRPENEKRAYYRYGIIGGFFASIVLSVGMLIYASFFELGIPESKVYIILLSLLPLIDFVMQYELIILRTQKMNKQYSLFLNLSSVTYFVFGCLGAYFWGISGTILGRYLSYAAVIILCYGKVTSFIKKDVANMVKLTSSNIRELWVYSIKNGLSSALNQILYLIDVFLISVLIKSPETVASYKVAVLIPEGLAFIPSSIMVFLIPIVAEHNKDIKWLKNNIRKLFLITGIMNLVISLLLIILAPYIISLLWGPEYLDSLTCFRILSINYFVMGTFRMSCTNILAVLRKVNFNLVLGIVSGILDVILDYVLIKNFAGEGAAWATLLTVIFISSISVPYLVYSLKKMEENSFNA